MIARALASMVLLLALHGCAGRGPSVPQPSPGLALNDICAQYNVSWQWDGVTQVVILEYKGNKAKALVGSNIVLLGKEKITLSAPLRRANSTIYVPEDFEARVLTSFGITPSIAGLRVDWTRLRVHTIMLDPGHGGKDPGAQGPSGVREKEVVLDIAKRIRSILQEAGIKVIMTRTNDEFISLAERTRLASRSDADLFISIHANANPVRKTEGMEAYYVRTHTKEDLQEDQRRDNERAFARKLNAQYSPMVTAVVSDMMYTLKTAESARLAHTIVEQSSDYANAPNRGARTCRFFVVRNTLVPAVLVEVGFLTNRREEKKLDSLAYRQKVAEAIARSVLNYATDS